MGLWALYLVVWLSHLVLLLGSGSLAATLPLQAATQTCKMLIRLSKDRALSVSEDRLSVLSLKSSILTLLFFCFHTKQNKIKTISPKKKKKKKKKSPPPKKKKKKKKKKK